ncbi:hypothetical protein [Streptomyces sp. NPDC002573]|uniref:hypothetical protein n=1 Tax=Streptomyces sp. NPDC002573 TaxID=3364651 RepID=UPI00367BE5AF
MGAEEVMRDPPAAFDRVDGDHGIAALDALLDQVLAWSSPLAPLRSASAVTSRPS